MNWIRRILNWIRRILAPVGVSLGLILGAVLLLPEVAGATIYYSPSALGNTTRMANGNFWAETDDTVGSSVSATVFYQFLSGGTWVNGQNTVAGTGRALVSAPPNYTKRQRPDGLGSRHKYKDKYGRDIWYDCKTTAAGGYCWRIN